MPAGDRRSYRRALLDASGHPHGGGRRLLQLPSLTPSVAAAAETTLEAVDVTLLLATASAAQVCRSPPAFTVALAADVSAGRRNRFADVLRSVAAVQAMFI